MFGFGKGKKKKNKKKDDDDLYRPQPVSLQRGWATTAHQSKSQKKLKKAHKKQASSGSLHKSKEQAQPPQPQQPPPPQEPPKPDPPVEPSQPEPDPSPNDHSSAQSYPHVMPPAKNNLASNSSPNIDFEHKSNPSMDSNISGVSMNSVQSAPLYNNYNYNYGKQPPPPSASSYYNHNASSQQQPYATNHAPQMSNKLSEGHSGPVTGQPEVVGDISSWKAQQQQQEEQKYNNGAYPNLQQPQHPTPQNNYSLDGAPSTGPNQLSGIDQFQPQQPQQSYYNDPNQRIRSAADEPEPLIASSISAYNPNMPAPNVPEESSSSDDDLNDLVSGNAFKNVSHEEEEQDDSKIKQAKMQPIKPEPSVEDNDADDEDDKKEPVKPLEAKKKKAAAEDIESEEAAKPKQAVQVQAAPKEEEEEEESDSDDDGGLSDWLISIGFKKKKLALMLKALSELGLDTMEDLETLLIDLYKNSYGNQQKQWMDKIQKDVLEQGIKYAQWIRFSTKAQAMIELKVKQMSHADEDEEDDEDLLQSADKDEDGKKKKKKGKVTKGGDYGYIGAGANTAGLPANGGFIVMQSDEAQHLENLRNAMSHIYSGIDNLDNLVLTVETNEKSAIENVEKEFNALSKQLENRKNLLIASISGVGEDKAQILSKQSTTLRSIAAEYEETLASFNKILADNQNIRGKNEISKRQQILNNLVTSTLSKYRNITMKPGCTPLIGFHCNITPVVLEMNKLGIVTWGNAPSPPFIRGIITSDWSITMDYDIKSGQNKNIMEDPIITYEVQCVLCKNEENLLWNFEYEIKKKKSSKSDRNDRKHKKKHGVIDHGIITKHVTSKRIVLVGFVAENKDYVLRVRCQNRNGWSVFSKCMLCKTKKKKKRKAKIINEKLKVVRHRGSTQDGSPNNLLFSNDKLTYQSLSNQDFINELTNYKKLNKNKIKEFNDWIIFDLGTFIELMTLKIKFDVHYRWGNVPKLIYLDLADYDDHSYSSSVIKKYKPISYDDDYHNPSDPTQMSGVLVQLRKKRLEEEKIFESIWNRLAIIECKKKSGWQDFNLYENIDESKRKGRFVRIQFVNNFDCNIEHYAKYVVEQLAFVGISYDD